MKDGKILMELIPNSNAEQILSNIKGISFVHLESDRKGVKARRGMLTTLKAMAKELVKDDGIPLVMDFMEIDMEEDRDDVVDAAKDAHKVLKDAIKLTKKYIEIEARQWKVYEDEDEYEDYLEEYYEAQEEALEDCNFDKLFEDLGGFGLDELF